MHVHVHVHAHVVRYCIIQYYNKVPEYGVSELQEVGGGGGEWGDGGIIRVEEM